MTLTKHVKLILLGMVFCLPLKAELLTTNNLPSHTNLVKAGGKLVTLLGHQVAVGDTAPDFKVVDDNFMPVSLYQLRESTILISVVPSLDTGVCSIQTKRFNDEASNLDESIIIITISNDLPFAQKRFCKNENVDQIKVFSDSVWRDFGSKYGLLIKDMGLLTRAIFIIDPQGIIAYKELVADISQHPDYDTALAELKKLTAISEEKIDNSQLPSNSLTTEKDN